MKKQTTKKTNNETKISTKWRKIFFVALGVIVVFVAYAVYRNQTDPRTQLIKKYGSYNVAYAEATYRNTVVVEKMCRSPWTKMAEESKEYTYDQIVALYYDLYSEKDLGRAFKLPKELIKELPEKLGSKILEGEQRFFKKNYKKLANTPPEANDIVCREALMKLLEDTKKRT